MLSNILSTFMMYSGNEYEKLMKNCTLGALNRDGVEVMDIWYIW